MLSCRNRTAVDFFILLHARFLSLENTHAQLSHPLSPSVSNILEVITITSSEESLCLSLILLSSWRKIVDVHKELSHGIPREKISEWASPRQAQFVIAIQFTCQWECVVVVTNFVSPWCHCEVDKVGLLSSKNAILSVTFSKEQ